LDFFFAKNLQAGHFPFQEVEEMVIQDDSLRIQWIYEEDLAVKNEIAQEIRSQEILNTQKIKKIILHSGLPLDDDISDTCKLILRSSDLNFQINILSQILTLDDESWRQWIPDLTDRILLRQGLPQRYGTHLHIQDGSYTPYSIENLENVDALRKEFCNLPLQTYIQKSRQIFIAILKADKSYNQKLSFNHSHNFYGNPDDYLYVILNEDDYNMATIGVSSIIAFDHPAHAAIHALRCQWDWDYEMIENDETDDDESDDDGESDCVICYKDLSADQFFGKCCLFSIPCYVFLLPREKFQSVPFEDKIFKEIFVGSGSIQPIGKFICDSFFDPLLTLEKEIRVENSNGSWTQLRTIDIDSSHLCSLLFDTTLENENF
jgi:hypothetical protein